MEMAKNPSYKGGKRMDTSTLVGIGVLTAVVVVMYFISMALQFTAFNITLTLVPIVVGAAMYDWKAGAWLGLVFGVVVLVTGGANAFLVVNAPGTIATVLIKGVMSGLVPALLYRLIAPKSELAAVIVAAISAPIANTGIFLLGCKLFFMDTISEWAGGQDVVAFMFLGLAGINFLIELGVNIVLAPTITRIVAIGKTKLRGGSAQRSANPSNKDN